VINAAKTKTTQNTSATTSDSQNIRDSPSVLMFFAAPLMKQVSKSVSTYTQSSKSNSHKPIQSTMHVCLTRNTRQAVTFYGENITTKWSVTLAICCIFCRCFRFQNLLQLSVLRPLRMNDWQSASMVNETQLFDHQALTNFAS